MSAPPSQFKPRYRPMPYAKDDPNALESKRRKHVEMLTAARYRLVGAMDKNGIPVRGDNKPAPVSCNHGVTWTECQVCSKAVSR